MSIHLISPTARDSIHQSEAAFADQSDRNAIPPCFTSSPAEILWITDTTNFGRIVRVGKAGSFFGALDARFESLFEFEDCKYVSEFETITRHPRRLGIRRMKSGPALADGQYLIYSGIGREPQAVELMYPLSQNILSPEYEAYGISPLTVIRKRPRPNGQF